MKGVMRLAHITRTYSGGASSRGMCAPGEKLGYERGETSEWVVYPLRDGETAESVSWGEALRRTEEKEMTTPIPVYQVDRAMLGDLGPQLNALPSRAILRAFCSHLMDVLDESGLDVVIEPVLGIENGARNADTDLVPQLVWNQALDRLTGGSE